MRWFFGHIEIGVFRKTAMETLFLHYTSHVINNRIVSLAKKTKKTTGSSRRMMARHVWCHQEMEYFLNLVHDRGITSILDSKKQINASIYQDLEAAMKEAGFHKPWQILRSKWITLKQKYLAEKRKLGKSGANGKD
ncbi:hypothetical protein AMECASPLE_028866 [Ameca splendens]|uniref:Myb/SANT-like DNA-binding domain-containing protein n=1 Tax=Ameca splendens TaxID=208324 RepID=A0ABV0ZQG4_9TELE